MLTRKHFRQFAETLKAIQDMNERVRQARTIIEMYRKDNPRFKLDVFLNACNIKQEVF